MWRENLTDDDPEISENTENPEHWSILVIVCVTTGASAIVSVIIGAVIYNRRFLCDRRSVHTEQQKKDDSATDSNVQKKEDDSAIYSNVQQQEEDSAIYANV
ncbi:hypothetical protein QTP86_017374 [Hemibagrus guttatus]|nr:hypothetical protein QTP86_017374 [Hemibagrus guttatus]